MITFGNEYISMDAFEELLSLAGSIDHFLVHPRLLSTHSVAGDTNHCSHLWLKSV